MIRFQSLKASGLPESFDAEIHGEQPVVKIEEKEDLIKISYIFPGFTVSDDDQQVEDELLQFKEVGIPGAGFVSESGKPLLPSFGRFLQIPANCTFELSVRKSGAVSFDDILITPAQEQATDGDESSYEFDRTAYSKDTLYPKDIVTAGAPQEMDGYRVIPLHVRPLQYNTARKKLTGYSNITVTIRLTAAEDTDTDQTAAALFADPGMNREGFGNLILNPRRPAVELRPVPRPGPIIRWQGPEFLIIHDDRLKNQATKLAHWKNMRGLKTEIIAISKVGNTVAKIKQYIRGRRKSILSRLRYVLLFGDVGAIVTEQTGGATTDHYYYTAKDPSGSTDCILPWVSGGRIPVTREEDAKNVVSQIIRYEKTPSCDADYYRRMTFAAYFQDDSPQDGRANRAYMKTMEGIRSHLTGIGFDVDRIYVSNNPNPQTYKDGSPVPAEVKNAIVDMTTATEMLLSDTSEGQLAVGHRDHGSRNGWAHPSFTTGHLDSIVSQYQSIFYSINCLTGQFDADPAESFAEAMLILNGGAPSLVAATELSGTWRNDSMIKALFDGMWPGVIPTFPGSTASYGIKYNRLGDLLNYAKSYLLVAHGTTSGVKNHFEIYHVIGDPTIQLWAHEPLSVSLWTRIQGDRLFIRLSTCPRGSTLTIWQGRKLLKRIAPSSNHITIPLRDLKLMNPVEKRPALRQPLMLCFSAPGCRFVSRRLRI